MSLSNLYVVHRVHLGKQSEFSPGYPTYIYNQLGNCSNESAPTGIISSYSIH